MVTSDIGNNQQQGLLARLQTLQLQHLDVNLAISNRHRQGVIQIREGNLVAAHTGILHGNGAFLTLAQLSDPEITVTPANDPVQKTVSITFEQIKRFLASLPAKKPQQSFCDEELLLQEAKDLFFCFRYRAAVEKLVTILRHNRFFYPAWLWQSRVLTRQDYIAKAIDEAYRWGNHDQDVWREARKMRPQIHAHGEAVKRCIFCWSILSENTTCNHCHAYLSITGRPQFSEIRREEISFALTHYLRAFQLDRKNARIAYTLALGSFNLQQHDNALKYMRIAAKLSPHTAIYSKSLSLLLALARAVTTTSTSRGESQIIAKKENASILMIEDSMTSRKVLSMLFSRRGYTLFEAASGAEALDVAKKNRPGLILLDVMLPDTTGHELLSKLREMAHLQKVPVIMLTGKHDAKDRLKGIHGGANEYITKPFDPQKLTELVQRYLRAPGKAKTVQSPASPTLKQAQPTQNRQTSTPPSQTLASAGNKNNATNRPIASQPAKPAKGTKSIFAIEDSHTSRKVLSMILTRNGYHLYEASTGQEALALAKDIQPDLVLLDVMLPDTTGYSLLPQLKKLAHFEKLPVIMLTGKSDAQDRVKGMLAGSNEYLTKPFDPQKLLSLITGYLG